MTTSLRALPRRARRMWPRTRFGLGLVLLTVVLALSVGLYHKAALQTFVRSGETITAEFDRNFKLTAHESKVLFAGIEAGVVSAVETREDGVTLVSMKVDRAALDKLGSEPSARVVPNTMLSGVFGVELTPGGATGSFDGGVIPNERTSTPVELDRILESLPAPTRQSLQNLAGAVDDTLARGGKEALGNLLRDAPTALKPTGTVLRAAQGTRPGVDLPKLVTNLNATAAAIGERRARLADILSSLRDTTGVLAEHRAELSAGIDSLPAALRATRAGVVDVRGTLDRLTVTAEKVRPVAGELDSLLTELGPVLRRARPVMTDLQPLIRDARAVVDQLVPAAQRSTRILDDLRGPVLDRVNGPIADTLMSTWRGTGPYAGSGGGLQADHRFYEELGYLAASADRGSMYQDRHGSMLGFQVGFNLDSLAPAIDGSLTLSDLVKHLQQATGGQR